MREWRGGGEVSPTVESATDGNDDAYRTHPFDYARLGDERIRDGHAVARRNEHEVLLHLVGQLRVFRPDQLVLPGLEFVLPLQEVDDGRKEDVRVLLLAEQDEVQRPPKTPKPLYSETDIFGIYCKKAFSFIFLALFLLNSIGVWLWRLLGSL